MPSSLRAALKRLARRLALGVFLDIWPAWAAASLLLAGLVALLCRLLYPAAAPFLGWLWLGPLLAAVPATVICLVRAYRPADVAALADWLAGGQGTLLTLFERADPAWAESPAIRQALSFSMPHIRPLRMLKPLAPAAMFLAIALSLPQRVPADGAPAALADEIAADLTSTVVELKQESLITPEEEQRLREEIERIRLGAQERVDTSAWEAADSVREAMIAGLSGKHDAVKWAQESAARYAAAAAEAAATGTSTSDAQAAELMKALDRLAKSGMLAGAPAELQRLAAGGKLPADPAAIRELTAALARQLAELQGQFGQLAELGRSFGRFDPSEFPVESGTSSPDGDGRPGRGGVNRGRGDAELTFGNATQPFDRFKSQALPPGAARSPDDWTPVMTLPGTPLESPTQSSQAAARQYAADPGHSAWRRSLAPRHQSAVRKYFDK